MLLGNPAEDYRGLRDQRLPHFQDFLIVSGREKDALRATSSFCGGLKLCMLVRVFSNLSFDFQ